MKITCLHLILAVFLGCDSRAQSTEEPRHLLVAKFTLQRLETVDLSDQQLAAFNKLSAELRANIDTLRRESGITKEVMARRDEAHRSLKDLNLKEEDYWTQLESIAELDAPQVNAFKTTAKEFQDFKSAAYALLSDTQKARLPKNNASIKKSTEKDKSGD